MIKLTYKPKEGDPWVAEFPEPQALKMIKRGRWKRVTESAPIAPNTSYKSEKK